MIRFKLPNPPGCPSGFENSRLEIDSDLGLERASSDLRIQISQWLIGRPEESGADRSHGDIAAEVARRYSTAAGRTKVTSGRLCMVPYVCSVDSDLNALAFSNPDGFGERHISVPRQWSADIASSIVSTCPRLRILEDDLAGIGCQCNSQDTAIALETII